MPNAAYIHLVLNHFPVIINIMAVIVLIVAILWKDDSVVRIAMLLFICAAIFAVPTYLTGDGAADIVKKMDGVNPAAIEPHDDSATVTLTLISIEAVGALAAWIAYRKPKELARWIPIAMLIFAILVSAQTTYTALLGGRIHHPESHMRTK
jgi:uncharacterized membrane protein